MQVATTSEMITPVRQNTNEFEVFNTSGSKIFTPEKKYVRHSNLPDTFSESPRKKLSKFKTMEDLTPHQQAINLETVLNHLVQHLHPEIAVALRQRLLLRFLHQTVRLEFRVFDSAADGTDVLA